MTVIHNMKKAKPLLWCVSLLLIVSLLLLGGGRFLWVLFTNDRMEGIFVGHNMDEITVIELKPTLETDCVRLYEDYRLVIFRGCPQFTEYEAVHGPMIDESEWNTLETQFRREVSGWEVERQNLVNLLKHGDAGIFDKQTGVFLTQIQMHYVDVQCGPLCGSGSIDFLFMDGTLMLSGGEWWY